MVWVGKGAYEGTLMHTNSGGGGWFGSGVDPNLGPR